MKRRILAVLLAVAVSTTVPVFAAEADAVKGSAIESAEIESAEIESAEIESVEIEDAVGDVSAAEDEEAVWAEETQEECEEYEAVAISPEEIAAYDAQAEDEQITGADVVNRMVKDAQKKTKTLGKVSGFKIAQKLYASDMGVYYIQLRWNKKKDAIGYLYGIFKEKNDPDEAAITGWYDTTDVSGSFSDDDVKYLTPHNHTYYFRVRASRTPSLEGLGKVTKMSKGIIIPDKNDIKTGTVSYTRNKTIGRKIYTTIEMPVQNNSDRPIRFAGANRYLKVLDMSTGTGITVKKFKLPKNVTIKPGEGVTLEYRLKGDHPKDDSNWYDINLSYAGTVYTERFTLKPIE